ncbi:Glycerol-3-phosphate regulon repressor [Chromobacterium violaceum]|uniref:Glycerol-3-phosphate regulon repressor n=1 Tax=Chromobacterium violaceum TaxID=536 RepID=A0A3S4HHU5_CHRVL|nr:Glycerol-3-phosphate regulon repressor [Chromobacterium violaceum]
MLCIEEKRRIAACVARHIPDNASLFINLGTTTEEVAKALHRHRGLRVITNNLHVAEQMCDYPDCEVIVLGGSLRKRDRGLTGEATVQMIRQFRVDYGIIGVSSIESDGTLRDYDYREVRTTEAIIQQSRQVFLAADHSKFDRRRWWSWPAFPDRRAVHRQAGAAGHRPRDAGSRHPAARRGVSAVPGLGDAASFRQPRAFAIRVFAMLKHRPFFKAGAPCSPHSARRRAACCSATLPAAIAPAWPATAS